MQIHLTFNDLRKLATTFRRPGVVLATCGSTPEGLLRLEVRADIAAFVDIAAKLNRPVPITVQVELNINIIDEKTLSIQLSALTVDKSELPAVIRPFLRPKQLRKKLFEAIPHVEGITVDAQDDRVSVALNKLAITHPLLTATNLKYLSISDQGVALELNFSSSELD